MTTTLSEHKQSRSEPWENYLYPKLRDPIQAKQYIEACFEDNDEDLLGRCIAQVIEANKDLPFIAYRLICTYSNHLNADDIPKLITALKTLDDKHQDYLDELYWWLDFLSSSRNRSSRWLRVEVSPLDVPEELKALDAYQAWSQVA